MPLRALSAEAASLLLRQSAAPPARTRGGGGTCLAAVQGGQQGAGLESRYLERDLGPLAWRARRTAAAVPMPSRRPERPPAARRPLSDTRLKVITGTTILRGLGGACFRWDVGARSVTNSARKQSAMVCRSSAERSDSHVTHLAGAE